MYTLTDFRWRSAPKAHLFDICCIFLRSFQIHCAVIQSQNAENQAIIQNDCVLNWSQVLTWLHALSCCSHILIEAGQSAPSLPFLSSILPLKCVKISWFPSLLSYRRRNFLSKHFTFLETGELLVQPGPVCFALLSVHYSNVLVANKQLSGKGWKGGGQDCTPSWKVFAELAQTLSSANGHALSAHAEFLTKGRKVCFPLLGPHIGRTARVLCGWILGSQLVKRSNFLRRRVKWGNCPVIQRRSYQNKHIRDKFSLFVFFFSLPFPLYLFPTSPVQAFPQLLPAATHGPLFGIQNICDVDEWEHMTGRLKTWSSLMAIVYESRLCSNVVQDIWHNTWGPVTFTTHCGALLDFGLTVVQGTNRNASLVLAKGSTPSSLPSDQGHNSLWCVQFQIALSWMPCPLA